MVIDGYVLLTRNGGKPVVGLEFENGITATALLDTGCNLQLVIDDEASISDLGLIVTDTGATEDLDTANGRAKYRIGITKLKLQGQFHDVSIHIRVPNQTVASRILPFAVPTGRRPTASDELSGHLPLLLGTQLLEGCLLTVVFARIESERRVSIRPVP
jgi:predicted aspartyl protease